MYLILNNCMNYLAVVLIIRFARLSPYVSKERIPPMNSFAEGNGDKDRHTALPEKIRTALQQHLARVKPLEWVRAILE